MFTDHRPFFFQLHLLHDYTVLHIQKSLTTSSFLHYILASFEMSKVPDWVLDSKLETYFRSKYETVHTYYEQESLSRRPIKKTVHWQREKKIGSGGFGEVWLERCTKGNNHGYQVRATKKMEVRHQIDYSRELEAIAKFSHSKVIFSSSPTE